MGFALVVLLRSIHSAGTVICTVYEKSLANIFIF